MILLKNEIIRTTVIVVSIDSIAIKLNYKIIIITWFYNTIIRVMNYI